MKLSRTHATIAGLVLLAGGILTTGGCEIFAPSKVVVPRAMVEALALPPDDPAVPGVVKVSRDTFAAYEHEYTAKVADEKVKIAERARADAEKNAADLAAKRVLLTRELGHKQSSMQRDLAAYVDAQAQTLEAWQDNADAQVRAIIETGNEVQGIYATAAARLDESLASAKRSAAAAIARADALDEKKLAVFGTIEKTVNAVAPGLGPWGLLATAGVGVVGGWLGLRKPGTVPAAVVNAANETATANSEAVRALLDAADRAGVLGAVGSFLHKSGDPRDVAIVNELAIKDGLKL